MKKTNKFLLLSLALVMIISIITLSGISASACMAYCEHEGGTFVETVAPTCNEYGYDLYADCSLCGEYYETNYVDELGHTGGNIIESVDSTCDRYGYEYGDECSRCGVDESAEKIVEISGVEAAEYSVGEVVEVALQSNSMGAMAVVLTYVVPFFVLALVLVAASAMGLGEGIAALAALGSVVVYYLVLYGLRDRVKQTIKFIIIKQTK